MLSTKLCTEAKKKKTKKEELNWSDRRPHWFVARTKESSVDAKN
jgi:hypothetical protein